MSAFDHEEFKEIVNDFDCKVDDWINYAKKRNQKWKQMNFIQYAVHECHPCPILSVSSQLRINNYEQIEETEVDVFNKFALKSNINIHTKWEQMVTNKDTNYGLINFTQGIYNWIIDGNAETIKNKYKWYDKVSIYEILNQQNDESTYCLMKAFGDTPNDQINIYLFVQNCTINVRDAVLNKQTQKYKNIGCKAKFHVVLPQTHWNKLNIWQKIWFYDLSYNLCQLIIDDVRGIIIGDYHYYYRYAVHYESFGNIEYCYINYSKNKPLKSVKMYYKSKFNVQSVVGINDEAINKIHNKFNVKISHRFYLGISVQRQVLSAKWKDKIYTEVSTWIKLYKNNKLPHYIHCDALKSGIRYKFFIYLKYFYRRKGMSTSEINKQEKIAGGLRMFHSNINQGPQWISELIYYLKHVKSFIPANILINQVGINIYLNSSDGHKNVYSFIDPHFEWKKFAIVYSISIYYNKNNKVWMSFNLKMNKSNGDCKIILSDSDGLIMYNPSWSLNTVKHSVSEYEMQFAPYEWRIVLLFRHVQEKNIQEAINFYNNNQQEEEKQTEY